MIKRLVVYGLLAIALALSVERGAYRVDDTTEIVIVKAPDKNRNPYQTEYEKLLYPAVKISAGWSTGTGVAIDDYILTAAHVVEDESTVTIETNDRVLTATVVITDTLKDLALLRPSQSLTYKARLAQKDYTAYVFTPVYVVGCSLGLNPRPSNGIISVVESDHWEMTAPVLPGNSGGPVYDAQTYEVIGIAVWVKVYNGQLVTTMAGVVPIGEIYKFLEQNNIR
ncbi:MAG: trypsin-like peptidase domain-containing protein [Planctomycetes bacterium]|nr:trypsin-like peptidase domain-containing protein [Planctomycetota bacterium]